MLFRSIADSYDHVPPLNCVENMRIEDWNKNKIPFKLIKCCSTCNNKLGDKMLYTVFDRLSYLLVNLEKQYSKLMDTRWSEKELKELGPNLLQIAKSQENKSKLCKERLDNCYFRFDHSETWPEYE